MMETIRTPVFSRYDVVEKIGRGGMGTVYKARDLHLDRWVALKVLPPGMQEDSEALERFRREARALARLKHPHVAAVFDASAEGGFPHLVMEYIEGENLEQVLRQRGPLPVDEVVRLGIEVAEALDHIHQHHLVHRDVKTANLIVGPGGGVVLTDFGIAFEASWPRISQGALGTPEYMSPEQAAGQPLDGRSDLYSLGIVLYEALTGLLPFQRSDDSLAALTALLSDVMERPVPSLRAGRADVPSWLEVVVARCLAKEPADRFATGAELARALRQAGVPEAPPVPEDDGALPAVPGRAADVPAPRGVLRAAPRRGITLISHVRPVDAVAFSPDSTRLASASEDGLVRLWQVADGQLLHTFDGHEGNVVSVAFSPDGRHLASGDVGGGVCVWDLGSGRLLRRVDGHTALVMAVAFSPDGRFLATGGGDRAVRLWNARRGTLERTVGWHDGYVLSVAFSPDGAYVASGGADGEVRLWDARKGKLVRALEGHGGWVMSVAYSPDGTTLAAGGADAMVHLWDVATGGARRLLQGHDGWVMSVAFSPGSAHVASAGRDHSLRLWEAGTGRLLRSLEGHTGPVMSVAFSPDARHLASASADRTVRLWSLHAPTFRPRLRLAHAAIWLLLVAAAAAGLWSRLGPLDRPTAASSAAAVAPLTEAPQRTVTPAPKPVPTGSAPAARTPRPAAKKAVRRPVPPPLYSREGIVPARGGWTLVVSLSRSRDLADQVAADYRRRGFRTGVLLRPDETGPQYAVGVGQYPARTDATKARARLAGGTLPFSAWVMRVR